MRRVKEIIENRGSDPVSKAKKILLAAAGAAAIALPFLAESDTAHADAVTAAPQSQGDDPAPPTPERSHNGAPNSGDLEVPSRWIPESSPSLSASTN
jgi:hypothetical protein